MLREQLEQAGLANEALSQDLRRLTVDWTKAREELEQRESDWRREEEVGNLINKRSSSNKYINKKLFNHHTCLLVIPDHESLSLSVFS